MSKKRQQLSGAQKRRRARQQREAVTVRQAGESLTPVRPDPGVEAAEYRSLRNATSGTEEQMHDEPGPVPVVVEAGRPKKFGSLIPVYDDTPYVIPPLPPLPITPRQQRKILLGKLTIEQVREMNYRP